MSKILESQLLIDMDFAPILHENECLALKPVMKSFISAYVTNKDKPIQTWLSAELKNNLPDKNNEEINNIANEIIDSIEFNTKYKQSLDTAISSGRSKESWFASEVKEATSEMSTQRTVEYLKGAEAAISEANESLYRTITTQSGAINRNPSLDGFIAEQYHAQTFNMNAKSIGSKYRAEVLQPNGSRYTKNSVDIVIKDSDGTIVSRYQSKYCKDAQATLQAFEKGDYRGQQKLIPLEQQDGFSKKSTTYLEAPDGTKSNPLTKRSAEQMRDEAQNGTWNELNWNEYKTKDLALGIGRKAAEGALLSAGISTGFDVAQRVWNNILYDEEINGQEIIENALNTGVDTGVKAAMGGALKVGVEKGIITVIPKGTPAATLANIAIVGVDVTKHMYWMATGKLSVKEGIEKIQETVVTTSAALIGMGEGAAIGGALGMALGPVGAAVGSFVGGSIGYMAGSKVGQAVVKTARTVRDVAKHVITTVGSGVKAVGNAITSTISNACSKIASAFGF